MIRFAAPPFLKSNREMREMNHHRKKGEMPKRRALSLSLDLLNALRTMATRHLGRGDRHHGDDLLATFGDEVNIFLQFDFKFKIRAMENQRKLTAKKQSHRHRPRQRMRTGPPP
jgi:hypothetical protein